MNYAALMHVIDSAGKLLDDTFDSFLWYFYIFLNKFFHC